MFLFICLIILAIPSPAAALELIDFSKNSLKEWDTKSFEGETQYRLTRDDSSPCIRADSHASASGLVRKIHIDLNKTPYMHWRWKIDAPLENNQEREKQGDDFAARIYLIVSGGLFFWNTKAINYVWANHEPVGSSWDNPYTSNSAMLAVESGAKHAGEWREYRRNVRKDLKHFFGRDIQQIDALALMTDTDNTGLMAGAYYGQIRFSAD